MECNYQDLVTHMFEFTNNYRNRKFPGNEHMECLRKCLVHQLPIRKQRCSLSMILNDVLYKICEWSTKKNGRLVIVPIGNTLNLSEQLDARVSSRLGETRITFQPYSQQQLIVVLKDRLMETLSVFEDDALQLVARKVASMSGDCRRALDICRRATEIGEKNCVGENVKVTMLHVQKTFDEMITNPKILSIKGCSKYEKFFLQAVEAEILRTGVDETTLRPVYQQLELICARNGVQVPDPGIALRISSSLGASRLLLCGPAENCIHRKIMLNVTKEEIYHGLQYRSFNDLKEVVEQRILTLVAR